MLRLKQSGFVWSLLLCLVLVNGFLAVPAVAHADHHAKHEAGAHSTGLCAWQCIAGQSIDATTVLLVSTPQSIETAEPYRTDCVQSIFSVRLFSRGPPSQSC
jgi:hypothetical protein